MTPADTALILDFQRDRRAFPPARNATTIAYLDGRKAFWTCGLLGADRWAWVVEKVAYEHDAPARLIGLLESDDGDMITIDGIPVYRLIYG